MAPRLSLSVGGNVTEALVEFLPPRQSLRLPRSENINGFRSGCKRRNHIADFEACRRPS